MFIDSHCHLDAAEFDDDRDAVVLAAQRVGVMQLILPAVERANFAAVSSVCRSYPGCHAAYGIHPLYTARAHPEDLLSLQETLLGQAAVAIGEIGLDHFVAGHDPVLQQHYFVAQLKLAQQHALPVLLHVRGAIDAVLQQLRRHPVPGGIAHAFNGSPQQAAEFIRLGFKLGFGGTLTFPRARRIRALAASLPLTSIVLETDAPDIPPAWQRGQRNTPDQLPRIAAELATLRQLTVAEIAQATTANVRAVLRLPESGMSRTEF